MASSDGGNRKGFVSPGRQQLNTPSPGKTIVSGTGTIIPAADQHQQSPSFNTESLARWVGTVKPVPQGLESRIPRILGGRTNSVASVGRISEAASRWDNHGRLDSCAASAWGDVHISDVESSTHDNDEDDDTFSTGTKPQLQERYRGSGGTPASRNEWNGLDNTFGSEGRVDDLGRSVDLCTTASSTFFKDLEGPSHRSGDSVMIGVRNRHDDEDDYDGDFERSPGMMTETASEWTTPRSQHRHNSRRPPNMTIGGHGEALSHWGGSPAPSPAGDAFIV